MIHGLFLIAYPEKKPESKTRKQNTLVRIFTADET